MKIFNPWLVLFISLTTLPVSANDDYKQIVSALCSTIDKSTNSVAVVGFSYSDGRDSKDGVVVAERISTELIRINKSPVVERQELEKVIKELKLHRTGLIDPSSSKDIGKMLGASTVVLGTLTELPENNIELHVRMVEVESGKVLRATSGVIKKDWLEQYRRNLEEVTVEIEKNPKDAMAFYNRGLINSDLKDYEAAIANFGLAITINPTFQEAYYARAGAYRYNGDIDKALEDYNKALQLNPNDFRVYFDRGSAYFHKGTLDKAIEDFTKVLSINPSMALAYYNRGQFYLILKEYDKAAPDFVRANDLEPEWLYSRPMMTRFFLANTVKDTWLGLPPKYMLGQTYYEKRDYDKAISVLDEAIKNDSSSKMSVYAYYFRGMSYLRIKGKDGSESKGMSDLGMAIKLDPEFYTAYMDRGFSLYMNEKAKAKPNKISDSIKSRVISDLSKAIDLASQNADAYKMRGMFYIFENEYKKALSDFDMALELDPGLAERAALGNWRNMAAAQVSRQEQ